MKFWLLGVWFGFFSFSALAQQDSSKTWQIRWAISSFALSRTPSLQVGVQKNITSKWAISAEYGLSTYRLYADKWYQDSVRENFRYQKFRAEVKRFSSITQLTKSLNTHLYLGVEGLFIPERYNKQTDYFINKGERYNYYFSRVKSNIYVACLTTGAEWRFKQKFALDTYLGLGPRLIHIRHYNTVFGYDSFFRSFIHPKDRREGWHTTVHVALGFKVGYYIW